MTVCFNLVNFIRALADRLMMSSAYRRPDIETLLNGVRKDLARIHEQYSMPPPWAAATQELLLEALELYDRSLDLIGQFLETEDEGLLASAIMLAEEANDVVMATEDVVSANKQSLNNMVTV